MEGTTSAAGGQVGTGSGFDSRNTGNNYTIDGASNNGFGRRIASSPNSDQIEEMRVETSNFDASQGHGTGLTVSMMTRGGTNALRGTANYTHWNNRLNSPNLQQKVTFAQDPRQEDACRSGRSHIGAFTLGGPIVIPKVVNGRGKAFFFANFSKSNDSAPGRLAGNSTVPANQKHLEGDFSDLLLLPSGAGATTPAGHHQYQIFDPLTTRPDPLRPGRVIRDPFPGNIIPKNRFMNPDGSYKNPAFGLYQAMVPAPNQNFLSPTQQPMNNYFRAAEPDQPHNTQGSVRVDYNQSDSSRFFIRANGNKFLESSLVDWTYDSPDPQFRGLHDVARSRFSWSVTGTWTKVLGGNTVIDTQISGNRAYQRDTRKNMVNYTPTSVGLPAYMDDFCQARFECILPQSNINPGNDYQAMGGTVDRGIWVTTYQGQSNLTSTRGSHTWRGGVDIQWAQRTAQDGAGNMGTFNYDNTYTRAADTTNVFPAQQIGLSLAAFMLGMPTSVSIADESGFDVRNNYFGTFVQDTWRVNRNLTLNLGLRFEYENGIKETQNRALLWFDPDAEVSIAAIARGRICRQSDPGNAGQPVQGSGRHRLRGLPRGTTSGPGNPRRSGCRVSRLATGWARRWRLKGGYGMYFDTLNARDWTPDQQGYNVTTTNPLSNDFGRTFALGDPRNGILPLVDPFPVRAATGSRYESVLGNALGLDTMLGRGIHCGEPEPQARARAAVASGLAARNRQPDGARGRVHRLVRRSAGNHDPPGLPARAVLEQRQRPRYVGERLPHGERAESVLHRELRLAPDDATRCSISGCRGPRSSRRRPSSATACCARSRIWAPEPWSELPGPAAGRDQGALARARPDAAVLQGPDRPFRVLDEPGDGEPDRRRVRPGADALADQQQRPALAGDRRSASTNCHSARAGRSSTMAGWSPTSRAGGA